jgi:aerobic-type carbon monoxide dehydrogenase small subunit (CoxS/CutS family)
VEKEVESRKNLADFLRQDLDFTGTHVGCEHGVCGSCTVLYNGAPVRSCLMLAVQADQAEIVTVEGLADGGALNPLQQAFKKNHALQCGFCTPGFLITASALLRQKRPLDEAEVRKAVAGNLCRCTGYQNIVNAIVEASGGTVAQRAMHGTGHGAAARFIGAPVERAEDHELLAGEGVFVDDINFPATLCAHMVRSLHAHAKILRIDGSAARRRRLCGELCRPGRGAKDAVDDSPSEFKAADGISPGQRKSALRRRARCRHRCDQPANRRGRGAAGASGL